MMKKLVESGLKITATKEGRKMAKEAFRKVFRKHKAEVKRTKKTKGAVPTVPYQLKKADLKKKIKGTKLVTKADIKAVPGARRRIILRIERAKKERKRGGKPQIFGKAYASDKAGKGMQIPLVSKLDRRKIQSDISESVRAFMKKKTGFKKGKYVKSDGPLNIYGRPIRKAPRQDILGKRKYVTPVTTVSPAPKKKNKGGDVKAIRTVAAKLSKASKAHAGQSKVLKRIVSKYV
jgi:hypothetical protein